MGHANTVRGQHWHLSGTVDGPAWYVLAWNLAKDAPRMFRMDRMGAASPGKPRVTSHSLASVLDRECPVAEAVDTSWLGRPLDGSRLTG